MARNNNSKLRPGRRHNQRRQTRSPRLESLETRKLLAGDLISFDFGTAAGEEPTSEYEFTSEGAVDPSSGMIDTVEHLISDVAQAPAETETADEVVALHPELLRAGTRRRSGCVRLLRGRSPA